MVVPDSIIFRGSKIVKSWSWVNHADLRVLLRKLLQRVRTAGARQRKARLSRLWFDAAGEAIERACSAYRREQIAADLRVANQRRRMRPAAVRRRKLRVWRLVRDHARTVGVSAFRLSPTGELQRLREERHHAAISDGASQSPADAEWEGVEFVRGTIADPVVAQVVNALARCLDANAIGQ